ncbi:MAG: hypothetical protein JOY51_01505 [Nevskia sp.]|nr:hypothetical protein [Nevskia sp.]
MYAPLPPQPQATVACDYTLTFADDPGRTVFCSFTRGRCGPHHCPLDKFNRSKRAAEQGRAALLASVPAPYFLD